MNHIESLLNALDAITGTGKYSTCGKTQFFFPEIYVEGEELAFPSPPITSKIPY
jgi:hypothetical protein